MSKIADNFSPADLAPVTGGDDLPARLMRKGLPLLAKTGDPLLDQINLLAALNPLLAVNFRGPNLATMSDANKRRLLADIRSALGVVPLR